MIIKLVNWYEAVTYSSYNTLFLVPSYVTYKKYTRSEMGNKARIYSTLYKNKLINYNYNYDADPWDYCWENESEQFHSRVWILGK